MQTAEGKIRLDGREYIALFDSGAGRSVISKVVADAIGRFRPITPYKLHTARKGVKLTVIGKCDVERVEVLGCPVPEVPTFEVSEQLDRDVIIGRPDLNLWEIELTREGPKLKRRPIRLEIV